MIWFLCFRTIVEKAISTNDLTLANNQSKNIGTLNVKLLNTYKKETDSKFILGANVLIKDRNKEYKLNPEQNLY